MENVLEELQKIPKIAPKPAKQKFVDYSERFAALESGIKELKEAVVAQETTVEAPQVNVAPQVEVTTDTEPLADEVGKTTKAIDSLKDAQPVKDGAMQTQDISNLVGEKYTRFNIEYIEDGFEDEEDPRIGKVKYYNGNHLVTTLVFKYKGTELAGVRKA